MEAVGVAASIVQLAAVGLALAQTLYSLCDEAASSKEQVKELAFYVRTTSFVLEEIGKVFQEETQATRPLISNNAIISAKEIVETCSIIFDTLRSMVSSAEESTIGLLKFTFRNSRLKVLQMNLGEMKINLQCMMQVIIYARLKAEPRGTFNESEQRELIEELIKQRLEAAELYQQAESQDSSSENPEQVSRSPETDTSQDNINARRPHSGSSPRGQSTTPNDVGCANNVNALAIAPNLFPQPDRPNRENHPNREDQPRDPGTPRDPELTYCSALYYVCCPVLFRRKRGKKNASCSHTTDYTEAGPDIVARIPELSARPLEMSAVQSRKQKAKQQLRQREEVSIREPYDAIELHSDTATRLYETNEVRQVKGKPRSRLRTTNIYRGPTSQSADTSPVYGNISTEHYVGPTSPRVYYSDTAVPVTPAPGYDRRGSSPRPRRSSSSARTYDDDKDRARSQSRRRTHVQRETNSETVPESEVDRLLHQWTTIYDET